MRKGLFAFLLAGLLALVLSSCGISAPNERKLIELIPDEVIGYTLDGKEYIPEITQLEILRQQFSEKDCVTECKISLEDDNLSRQEYIQLNCTYWDTGGWGLESWEELQAPIYTLRVPFETDRFLRHFERLGYHSDYCEQIPTHDEQGHLLDGMDNAFAGEWGDNTETWQCAAYRVGDPHENLTVYGIVPMTSTFIMVAEFPRTFYWHIEADTSGLFYDWDISGTWYCEFEDRGYNHYMEALLQSGAKTKSTWDGTMYYPLGGTVLYDGEEQETLGRYNAAKCHDGEYPSMYLTLELHGYRGTRDGTYCRVYFYPDYAELALVELNNWSVVWETQDERYDVCRI